MLFKAKSNLDCETNSCSKLTSRMCFHTQVKMQRNFRPELSTADWHTGNAKQSIGASLLAVTFQASNQIEVSLSGLTDTQRTALGFCRGTTPPRLYKRIIFRTCFKSRRSAVISGLDLTTSCVGSHQLYWHLQLHVTGLLASKWHDVICASSRTFIQIRSAYAVHGTGRLSDEPLHSE